MPVGRQGAPRAARCGFEAGRPRQRKPPKSPNQELVPAAATTLESRARGWPPSCLSYRRLPVTTNRLRLRSDGSTRLSHARGRSQEEARGTPPRGVWVGALLLPMGPDACRRRAAVELSEGTGWKGDVRRAVDFQDVALRGDPPDRSWASEATGHDSTLARGQVDGPRGRERE